MKKRLFVYAVVAILAAFLFGCATVVTQHKFRNLDNRYSDICDELQYDGTPIIYSGTYTDINNMILYPFTASGEGGLAALPFYPIILTIGLIDLPFSLAADTLLLPYTIYYRSSLNCEEMNRERELRKIPGADFHS